jgi:hypothetical protein
MAYKIPRPELVHDDAIKILAASMRSMTQATVLPQRR